MTHYHLRITNFELLVTNDELSIVPKYDLRMTNYEFLFPTRNSKLVSSNLPLPQFIRQLLRSFSDNFQAPDKRSLQYLVFDKTALFKVLRAIEKELYLIQYMFEIFKAVLRHTSHLGRCTV